jgi:hypothetical protein
MAIFSEEIVLLWASAVGETDFVDTVNVEDVEFE